MDNSCDHSHKDAFCKTHNQFTCLHCCTPDNPHYNCDWNKVTNLAEALLKEIQEQKKELAAEEAQMKLIQLIDEN